MAKFAVYAVYTASKYLGEIEADSPDEAKSKAEETYDDTYVSLCHQMGSPGGEDANYHWHVDACFDECDRRGKREIYEEAYKAVERSI